MAMSAISVGSTVHVSASAVENGRSFDFGEVIGVNSDGTFAVGWSKAGCLCMGVPNEAADQLTLSTEEAANAYYYSNTLPEGIDAEKVQANAPTHSLSFSDDDDEEDDYEEDDYEEDDYDEDDEESAEVAIIYSGPIELSPTAETRENARENLYVDSSL
jgi:hypothetical protein